MTRSCSTILGSKAGRVNRQHVMLAGKVIPVNLDAVFGINVIYLLYYLTLIRFLLNIFFTQTYHATTEVPEFLKPGYWAFYGTRG